MKLLKVLVLGFLLLSSSIIKADGMPTSYQCNVVSSMASTVQRMRQEFGIDKNEMVYRAIKHTPPQLQRAMIAVIELVYSSVPLSTSPETLYKESLIDCMGIEV